MRPNPLPLSLALKRVTEKGLVRLIPKVTPAETPFYIPVTLDPSTESFRTLISTRRHLYLLHKGLTERNDFCADVLESLVDSALESSGALFRSRFPKQNLPSVRPLDFVVELNGVPFGGEAKNYREWLYPESVEIWQTISKCCEIEAVPVLITRKLPYVSFLLFKRVGMLGYQTHFQYFHPVVEPELTRIKAVDGLGYKDIRCSLKPDTNILRFFQNTVPKVGPEFKARFDSNRPLLLDFADRGRLSDKTLHPGTRAKVFSEAWKALFGHDISDDELV